MNADVFAEWLRRRGNTVVRTASSYWHSQDGRTFQAFPYHWLITPPEDELTDLLRENRALGLRYSTPFDTPQGCVSYHAVFERATYSFDDLGKWARKNVRRGLRNCSVEPISFERLAEDGFLLQRDTLRRQGRSSRLARRVWERCWLSAADLPGFEAWGALAGGRLAASVVLFQMDDWCYLLYQQCHRVYLSAHVNNALSFVATQTMLRRPGVRAIFYGLHSLDAPASVDKFKFRMGYVAKPVRQRVVFHPWLAPFVNPVTHTLAKWVKAFRPSASWPSKGEGMMRFYLEGNRFAQEQSAPQRLRNPAIHSAD